MKEREVDKVHKVKDKSQIIGNFLEWLQSQGYSICELDSDTVRFYPANKGIELWLADYFGIDLKKLKEERRVILDDIREKNKHAG